VTSKDIEVPRYPREDPGHPPGDRERKRRPGSRLLLAAALAGGVIAAFLAGARISDFLCDIMGVASTTVRLVVKVASVAVALPAGFYLVEWYFLARANRSSGHPPNA